MTAVPANCANAKGARHRASTAAPIRCTRAQGQGSGLGRGPHPTAQPPDHPTASTARPQPQMLNGHIVDAANQLRELYLHPPGSGRDDDRGPSSPFGGGLGAVLMAQMASPPPPERELNECGWKVGLGGGGGGKGGWRGERWGGGGTGEVASEPEHTKRASWGEVGGWPREGGETSAPWRRPGSHVYGPDVQPPATGAGAGRMWVGFWRVCKREEWGDGGGGTCATTTANRGPTYPPTPCSPPRHRQGRCLAPPDHGIPPNGPPPTRPPGRSPDRTADAADQLPTPVPGCTHPCPPTPPSHTHTHTHTPAHTHTHTHTQAHTHTRTHTHTHTLHTHTHICPLSSQGQTRMRRSRTPWMRRRLCWQHASPSSSG